MPESFRPIEEIRAMLAEHPERIARVTTGIDPGQLVTPPEPGSWSVRDILAHIRACADVWGGNIQRIVAEDHPTIRTMSPRTWIRRTEYQELDFAPSFQAFRRQRSELVAFLAPLSPEDWARAALVTGMKPPYDRSVHWYADDLAGHERKHVRQIARTVETVRGAQP